MSSALLPPLPALIPIAALRKSPPSNNNSGVGDGGHRDCAPCANHSKIMGEQRSRRPGRQPSVDLIDNARSRGSSAAPQARKIRTERHRKSDRRRDRRRRAKTKPDIEKLHRYVSKKSPERPVNPRVNPIFVWVRQEDTRIVEVKCEDYDKRNRILLTKTPQGWRATPRTETLAPSLKEEADKKHHHHHRSKKSKKHKTKQKSTSVQVDDMSDEHHEEATEETSQQDSFPSWECPVNVESLLPSHTIHVPRKNSPSAEQSPPNSPSVNSGGNISAQTQSKCSADKLCDLSLLDNLLAVAELEFNQQIESGEWDKSLNHNQAETVVDPHVDSFEQTEEEQKIFSEVLEHLTNSKESCLGNHEGKLASEDFIAAPKEDCDYTEDDENNSAMGEVLTRIELSLQSPIPLGPSSDSMIKGTVEDVKPQESNVKYEIKSEETDCNENEYKAVSDCENLTETLPDTIPENIEKEEADIDGDIVLKAETIDLTEEETNTASKFEEPTDLSLKPKADLTIEIPSKDEDSEQPTDLSIPRKGKLSPLLTPILRPPSQSSEALQSPQPSGIPAIPPSPDILSPSTSSTSIAKCKATFLETLLATTSPKMSLNSEVTIERQKEPLDLGKCRKSASPTITCSEEVNNKVSEDEPPTKKMKTAEPITLKELLDNVMGSKKNEEKSKTCQESPKLLELLNTDSDMNAIVQLQQVLSDKSLNVPDPMLVPKEVLSKIIANPAKEIPELLKNRPELRLPEALAFPHLLQDPDILVITLQQLETIVRKQNQPSVNKLPTPMKSETIDKTSEKSSVKSMKDSSKHRVTPNKIEETVKTGHAVRDFKRKSCNELSDMDVAANSAFNQMFWLPYMNQMEALQFGGNSDFMKMLANANMPTTFPTQMSDLSHMLSNNRYQSSVPPNIAMHYSNPLELQIWQEAMLQTSPIEHKSPSGSSDMRNTFKDFMDKMNYNVMSKSYMQNHKFTMQNKHNIPNQFFQTPASSSSLPHPYMNLPQSYQGNMNVPIPPQFNAMFAQKNLELSKHQSKEMQMNFANNHSHHEKTNIPKNSSQHGRIRTKPAYKLMNTVPPHPLKEKIGDGHSRQLSGQPIDLSGATTTTEGRLKVRQQLMESWNHRKLLRHDDIPEVGSTTASIEEMQEAHKHLWHPLFGNEKGYNTPWNWTSSATATAE